MQTVANPVPSTLRTLCNFLFHRYVRPMLKFAFLALLLTAPTASPASGSLFSRLVDASPASDLEELTRLLSTETLSSSMGTVLAGNRVNGGPLRHGVSAKQVAEDLQGCTVKQWRDVGTDQGDAYILWECPEQRAPENDCYYYSFRAEMLDPRFHPANLFIHKMPSWDARCGVRRVAPVGYESRAAD